MKLLHYTYRNFSLFFLLLLAVWGVLFYYTILDEVVDETDDALENYREILVNTALQDSSFLESEGSVMLPYKFRPISKGQARNYGERFYDSTIYIEIEDEEEPVRVMESCFMMPDGQYYELTIKISTLEKEDMIEAILTYLIALFFILLICTMVVTHFILKRSFRPLNRLLVWLENIKPGKEVPHLDAGTNITEIRKLTDAAIDMSHRSYKAYLDQKQFIENASHELQTPLAIARGKLELFAEGEDLTEQQMKDIDEIYATLGRAVKLNKSLLLLTRIENKQYLEKENVVFNTIIEASLQDLADVYEWKHIRITKTEEGEFAFYANASLVQILVSNLLKNALVHNVENGELQILITSLSITIKNTGDKSLNTEKVFNRFYHDQESRKDSNGLGLAIAKSITNSFGLQLKYVWDGMHCFVLTK